MKNLLLVVCLFVLPVSLMAQQANTSGLELVSPLILGVGADNNFLVDRTNPNEKLLVLSLPASIQPGAPNIRPQVLDDKFIDLTLPTIALNNVSRRHDLTVTWMPEFSFYKHNGDLDAVNQVFVAGFNYFLKRNMQFALGEMYRTSNDPARTLQNVFLLLPLNKYRENNILASFEFQPDKKTSIGAHYDNTYTKFGQTDQFQARILDAHTTGYSFTLSRMVSRNHRVRAMYSIVKVVPINQAKIADDAVDTTHSFENPVHALTLQYRGALDKNTIVEASGGIIHLDSGWNYTFRGTLDKRLATFYWLGASYSRTLTFLTDTQNGFAQALGGNGFYDVVVVRFTGQMSRKTAIMLDASYSHGVSGRIVQSNQASLGRARFDYRLNDRAVAFTQAEMYQQNQNIYVQAPLTRTRYTLGIEFSFSSEAQRRTSRLNQDTRNVGVTDHPRRTDTPDE